MDKQRPKQPPIAPPVIAPPKVVAPFKSDRGDQVPDLPESDAGRWQYASRKRRPRRGAWLAWISIPLGAISGISVALVLLWVCFGRDPLGIMNREVGMSRKESSDGNRVTAHSSAVARSPLAPAVKQRKETAGVSQNGKSEAEKAASRARTSQGGRPSAGRNENLNAVPRVVRKRIEQGIAFFSRKEYRRALEEFQAALKNAPRNAIALTYRGLCRHKLGDVYGALADLDRAVELAPHSHIPLKARGGFWMANGDLRKAVSDFTEAIRRAPKDVASYRSRAVAWRRLHRYEEALNDLKRALEINSGDVKSLVERSMLHSTARDPRFRDGRKALEEALQAKKLLMQPSAEVLAAIAAAHAELGDFDKAVEYQAEAVKLAEGELREEYQRYYDLFAMRRPLGRPESSQESEQKTPSRLPLDSAPPALGEGARESGQPSVPDDRLSIPADAARRKAESIFDEAHGEEIRRIEQLPFPDRFEAYRRLTSQLQDEAVREKNPVHKYVLRRRAVDCAISSGDPALTWDAIKTLTAEYRVDELAMRADAVRKWDKTSQTIFKGEQRRRVQRELVRVIVELAEQMENAGRLEEAMELYKRALDLASVNKELRRQIRQSLDSLRQRAATLCKLEELEERLRQDPSAERELEVGIVLAVELEDWKAALPHLARCSDKEVRAAAKKDIAGAQEPEHAADIGDLWWKLGEAASDARLSEAFKARAFHWYLPVLDRLGPLRAKAIRNRWERYQKSSNAVSGKSQKSAAVFRATPPSIIAFDLFAPNQPKPFYINGIVLGTESNIRYWKPAVAGQWGEIVYRFQFRHPIKAVTLTARLAVWRSMDPTAEAMLYVSSDGKTWSEIARLNQGREISSYDDPVTIDAPLVGQRTIYVRAVLRSGRGGAIYAQFLRSYTNETDKKPFEMKVDF